MRLRFTELAAEQADAEDLWWREHRDKAPGLFAGELEEMLTTLIAAPEAAPLFGVIDGVPMRRIQLKKTQCHLYFSVEATEVVVHYVWGARRRERPGGKSRLS